MSLPMHFADVFSELDRKREACHKAVLAGEYVWAAYYANDLEAIVRSLIKYTHSLVEIKHADPQAALGGHKGSPFSPTKGD